MTPQEHKLLITMFSRMHEAFEIISDTLKSREIWTDDDEKAFFHAVHADREKIARFARDAGADYLRCAASLGVVTGLEPPPAPPPTP
jgi:hypothetical protein